MAAAAMAVHDTPAETTALAGNVSPKPYHCGNKSDVPDVLMSAGAPTVADGGVALKLGEGAEETLLHALHRDGAVSKDCL